jgi:formate dehydrogenase
MVAHYSGTTLDAQARYANGTKKIIQQWLAKEPIDQANVIVQDGKYASRACKLSSSFFFL